MSPKATTVAKVAVVEDNRNLRKSICDILNNAEGMRCVADYGTGEEAIEKLPALKPDVVLMDIQLPGKNGVECVQEMAKSLPSALVMMLTVQSNFDSVFESLRAGACGYLRKPVIADELVSAVREVIRGGSPMTAGIARQVVNVFKGLPPSVPASASKPLPELTDHEREILELLAQGYLYKEIGEKKGTSWHTVHNSIRRIYEKLQVRSRAQAIAKYYDL